MSKSLRNQINSMEKEIIILKAAIEIIDSIINHEVLELFHNDPHSQIRFNTRTHQNFFCIFLVDFLSTPNNNIWSIKEANYISLLKELCSSPAFNQNNSIEHLKKPVNDFYDWLETEITIPEMWFPSMDSKLDLIITRKDFLYISGNIVKHNFTRLNTCATKLQRIFHRNGKEKEKTDCLLALEDFYNWSHGDGNIFGYLSSIIAEYLNNIRWGIHRYLMPEFSHSYTKTQELKYFYIIPDLISNSDIKVYYWNLMNDIRRTPYIPEFKITKYLKCRY